MKYQPVKSPSHAVYLLRLHIVLVTKYRRKVLTPKILSYAEKVFSGILESWRCSLIEFGGEEDHVHLLIDIHPALNLSTLINNLKSASSRRIRNKFPDHIKRFYSKPVFWHRGYFAGTVGKVTLETVRRYVEEQGTKEKPRKQRPNLSA
ncbi:MAG TPA: IS200/IS605 family transposase [Nitrospirota bacterium]